MSNIVTEQTRDRVIDTGLSWQEQVRLSTDLVDLVDEERGFTSRAQFIIESLTFRLLLAPILDRNPRRVIPTCVRLLGQAPTDPPAPPTAVGQPAAHRPPIQMSLKSAMVLAGKRSR